MKPGHYIAFSGSDLGRPYLMEIGEERDIKQMTPAGDDEIEALAVKDPERFMGIILF